MHPAVGNSITYLEGGLERSIGLQAIVPIRHQLHLDIARCMNTFNALCNARPAHQSHAAFLRGMSLPEDSTVELHGTPDHTQLVLFPYGKPHPYLVVNGALV